jgi:hypothetical protein
MRFRMLQLHTRQLRNFVSDTDTRTAKLNSVNRPLFSRHQPQTWTWGLRLAQPGGPTDELSALFPPFYLMTNAESSSRNVVIFFIL